MKRRNIDANGWAIRVGGVALLALACLAAHYLGQIGIHRSGNEPASAYALALIVFLGASLGAAMAALGSRLTARVTVAERWLPHIPVAFREAPASLAPEDTA